MNTFIFQDSSFKGSEEHHVCEILNESGWALVQIHEASEESLLRTMLDISVRVGKSLSTNSLGYHILESRHAPEKLPAHTEGISNAAGIIPYFALGCLQPSVYGGETRIFDGRRAARLAQQDSLLSGVEIEYSALANPEAAKRHPLVVFERGGVLRYRSKVVTNRLVQTRSELNEEEIYKRVDAILEESVIACHKWQVGDLLFVNNEITLHDRLPFSGKRRMLRVRYNDTEHIKMRY